MRWGAFTLALVAAIVLQTSVVWILGATWLDLFLLLALLTALNAPVADARLAAWIAGFAQDLAGGGALGLHAFTLGLTAWLLTWLRETVPVRVAWGRVLLALVAAWPGQLLAWSYLHLWLSDASGGGWAVLGGSAMAAALHSLLAVVIASLPWLAPRRRRFGPIRR